MLMAFFGPAKVRNLVGDDRIREDMDILMNIAPLIKEYQEEMAHWVGHSVRVARMTCQVAVQMNASPQYVAHYTAAAYLHDWGKRDIGVSDLFYSGDNRLYTPEERFRAGQHGFLGARIAEKTLGSNQSDAEVLWHIKAGSLLHHHNFNTYIGAPEFEILFRGKPYECRNGKAIPFIARILAVTDLFDGLTAERSYRRRWSMQEAILFLQSFAGTRFDPDVVKVFVDEVLCVKLRFQKLRVGMFPLSMRWNDFVFQCSSRSTKICHQGG